MKETCEEISKRYEIKFLEIGTEGDHIHFLVQSVPRGKRIHRYAVSNLLDQRPFRRIYLAGDSGKRAEGWPEAPTCI